MRRMCGKQLAAIQPLFLPTCISNMEVVTGIALTQVVIVHFFLHSMNSCGRHHTLFPSTLNKSFSKQPGTRLGLLEVNQSRLRTNGVDLFFNNCRRSSFSHVLADRPSFESLIDGVGLTLKVALQFIHAKKTAIAVYQLA